MAEPLKAESASKGNLPVSGEGNALTREEKLIGKTLKKNVHLSPNELAAVNTKEGLLQLLSTKNVNVQKALMGDTVSRYLDSYL